MKKGRPVVGVRELRTHLSAYLRAVVRGETVLIGDRRRQPIARLVPVVRSPEEEHLARLAERGVIELGVGKPGRKPPVKPRKPGLLASAVVIEDRR